MSTLKFPTLKTGISVQHPFRKAIRFSTRVLEFMDGGEQRIEQWSAPSREWYVSLAKLDESEVSQHGQLFEASLAGIRDFDFADPIDGQEYTCQLGKSTTDVKTDSLGSSSLEVPLVQRK